MSIVEDTRAVIEALFSTQNCGFWLTLKPTDVKVATLAPSSNESHKHILSYSCDDSILCLDIIKTELL